MNLRSRTFLTAAVALLLAGAVVLWLEILSIRQRRLSEERLNERSRAMAASASTAEENIRRLQRERQTLLSARTERSEAQRMVEDRENPRRQLKDFALNRARLPQKYRRFFRMIQLDPNRAQQLLDCIERQYEDEYDTEDAVLAAGGSYGDPDSAAAIRQLKAEAEKSAALEENQILGPQDLAQLQEYQRTLRAQALVSGYAGRAALDGVPFSADQSEQLLTALVQANAGYKNGDPVNTEEDWSAVDQQIAPVLTPAQMAMFQNGEPTGQSGGRAWIRFINALGAATKAEHQSP